MAKRRVPRYQRDADDTEPRRPEPTGRIVADLSQQAPSSSDRPPLFYEDTPFTCIDCGKEEVWTAKQQQWWYEVAKGSVYSRANRCRDCRRKRRALREAGSPAEQPIRHVGQLLKLIRAEIGPALDAAGFSFNSRNRPTHPGERAWIEYERRGQIFSFSFEPHFARLDAELLKPDGDVMNVATTEFQSPRSTAQVMATIKEFATAVLAFLASMPADS